jgi:hypothetical protein
VTASLEAALSDIKNKQGRSAVELHPWERLAPFANIARMIDVLTLAIKIMLVSIVLVSVMNVMVMAVYERIREIGAIAAIGTPPRRILALFLSEGLLLGVVGTIVGVALSLGIIYALNVWKITFAFGQQRLLLAPSIAIRDVVTTPSSWWSWSPSSQACSPRGEPRGWTRSPLCGTSDSISRDISMLRLLFAALFLAVALPAGAADGNEILRKVDSNLEPESYEMYRKLINIEPDGSKKEFVLYSVKKGRDKVVALFLAPPSDKGRGTLRLADNMWLYIPNVGKPVRITSLQSVVGGVFNNSDILRVDYAVEYNAEGVQEEKDSYILALKARTG